MPRCGGWPGPAGERRSRAAAAAGEPRPRPGRRLGVPRPALLLRGSLTGQSADSVIQSNTIIWKGRAASEPVGIEQCREEGETTRFRAEKGQVTSKERKTRRNGELQAF